MSRRLAIGQSPDVFFAKARHSEFSVVVDLQRRSLRCRRVLWLCRHCRRRLLFKTDNDSLQPRYPARYAPTTDDGTHLRFFEIFTYLWRGGGGQTC